MGLPVRPEYRTRLNGSRTKRQGRPKPHSSSRSSRPRRLTPTLDVPARTGHGVPKVAVRAWAGGPESEGFRCTGPLRGPGRGGFASWSSSRRCSCSASLFAPIPVAGCRSGGPRSDPRADGARGDARSDPRTRPDGTARSHRGARAGSDGSARPHGGAGSHGRTRPDRRARSHGRSRPGPVGRARRRAVRGALGRARAAVAHGRARSDDLVHRHLRRRDVRLGSRGHPRRRGSRRRRLHRRARHVRGRRPGRVLGRRRPARRSRGLQRRGRPPPRGRGAPQRPARRRPVGARHDRLDVRLRHRSARPAPPSSPSSTRASTARHPDLDGQLVAGTSILDGSAGTTDPNGHGTWMAGIIAAATDNGQGHRRRRLRGRPGDAGHGPRAPTGWARTATSSRAWCGPCSTAPTSST